MADQFYTDHRGQTRRGNLVHSAVSVTNVSTPIVAANADRRFLIVQNVSVLPLFIKMDGTAAVISTGYLLLPGQSCEWPCRRDRALHRGPIAGIVPGGTALVLVSEA